MTGEELQGVPLEALSNEELTAQAKGVVEEVKNLGYPNLDLSLLMTGSRYRLDTLFYAAKRRKEDESSRDLTEEETDELWKSMAESYDGLSKENLTETFRYQYNREQKEQQLNGPKYPELDTPEYQSLLDIFKRTGQLLKEFRRRYPDQSPSDYLPS